MGTKPTIEEVLKYAEPIILKFIGKLAADLPQEHREEILQEARLRVFEAYAGLDKDAGWKSFVYMHSKGAVLDYLKFGQGFYETKWSIAKAEIHGSKNMKKIRERVSLSSPDEEADIDKALGARGVFNELQIDRVVIRWELVARMARIDQCIHAMARHLTGVKIDEMTDEFDKCRSRVQQLIQAFIDRFDDPIWTSSPWFLQTCYAFGLCRQLGIPDIDQSLVVGHSVGWNLEPIDLETMPEGQDRPEQLSLFDAG